MFCTKCYADFPVKTPQFKIKKPTILTLDSNEVSEKSLDVISQDQIYEENNNVVIRKSIVTEK